jgi:hypothetical protein
MSDLYAKVGLIRDAHRTRIFGMEQRKRADLSLGAFLRMQLGWRRIPEGLDKKEIKAMEKANDAAKASAGAIIDMAEKIVRENEKSEEKRKEVDTDIEGFTELGFIAIAAVQSRMPFAKIEADALKTMEKTAKSLPVWSDFAEPISGFGAASLAVIIGEAGNLSNYSNPGKLWKRFGVAPFTGNDGRDHLPSSFRGKKFQKADLTKAEWSVIGYSPSRRSRLFMIADAMLKKQSVYRELFLQRLAFEHRKAELACIVPATTTAATVESWANRNLPPLTLVKKIDPELHKSAGHMTALARVKMEKQLLKDLWRAWRRLERLPYRDEWSDPVEFAAERELIAA